MTNKEKNLALHAGREDVEFILLTLQTCEVGDGIPRSQEKNQVLQFLFPLSIESESKQN